MSTQIEIKSHPGTFVTLDDDVADKIGDWGWCLNGAGYAFGRVPGSGFRGRSRPCTHAAIWARTGQWPPKGTVIDHINHDKLDNRISQLRYVTYSINSRNMLKREGTTSKYKGVYFNHTQGKYIGRVGIRIEKKIKHIISSITQDEALAAMCADCIRDLVGGFIPRNFPELSFLEKWKSIGEPQRRQIFRSMAIHNVPIHDNTIFIEQKAA
jgi:hypothetical protein